MLRKNALACSLWLGVALCIVAAGAPADREVMRRIKFDRGSTSAIVEGAVVRGTRDRYLVAARRGQKVTVRLSSLETNAVFDIYAPGGKARLNSMSDTTIWEGRLPASGDFRLSVGPTRGNATYTLEVTIEN